MSKFSVKKPFTVFVAVIAVIVLGIVSYTKMTPDLLPNMDFPYIMIMTTYPGASPETVEEEITKPLEQSMSTLEHIKEVTSSSGENYSMVMLEFEESVNLDTIGVDIQQNLVSLQAGWDEMVGAPYVLKINPSMLPVEVAAVSVKGMDTVELTQFVNEELMNKLEGIAGVARISTSGAVVQQLHVVLDQQKLDQLNAFLAGAMSGNMSGLPGGGESGQDAAGLPEAEQQLSSFDPSSASSAQLHIDMNSLITMDMVKNILVAQNFSMPAGTIQSDGVAYMVSIGDEITTVEDLENLVLFDMNIAGLPPICLKDVAGVMVTDNRDSTYAKLDNDDSLVLSFEKQSTYSTAETTDNIEKRFRQLEKEYDDLKFVSLMNQGDYIYMIVETILNSLLLGALFAVLILFLFLRDWRPTIITLCSIPISVIFAIVLMYFSGVTINMISLSGLAVAVGMLVDNSIVVIENIYRLRAKGASSVQAAVAGAKQVAGAVTASTLTTICVFAPIVFVTGITKQLFTDLALTMTYALLASLIVSLTLVPAMATGLLKKEKKNTSSMPGRIIRGYTTSLNWSLRHKWVVLPLALLLLIGSAAWSLSGGFVFMPESDSSSVTVTVTMPKDATVPEAAALSDEVLNRIHTLDGIKTTGAMMGSGGMLGGLGNLAGATSTDVTIYVILKDENAAGSKIAKRIESLCADMECEVTASSSMMDMSMLTGSGVSLNIYCEDMEKLQAAAKLAGDALSTLPGVAEVTNGLEDVSPAIHISIDKNKAMQKGLTVAQIYMELSAALQSETIATDLNLDGTTTSVVVKKPEASVMTLDTLENYTFSVTSQTGETSQFTLSEVATVEETVSLQAISRLRQRRYISVTAILEDGQNVTLATEKARSIIEKLDLGEGVTYQFTGENEAIMEAVEQMLLMLLLGVLLVYLVMVAQFQSLKSPFIVMFTIPLAFTGGFLGLLICGMEVSVISLIGFVMLAGIIVNNGIVLVDYINQLRMEGVERREAIVEAGVTRMRPILMTTLTTILGLIDMAVRKTAGTTLMQPVAVVCISGLLYATLMTLYVVPCIYDMMNKKELRKIDDADLADTDL